MCLFPGDEVYRLPERGLYPRDAWERRDREDEHIIDATVETLPLSDYAITVGCLAIDANERETGYYYRVLDPMAQDATQSRQLSSLWEQLREMDYFFSDEPVALPGSHLEVRDMRAELFYSRLALGIMKDLRRLPQADLKLYEFLVDESYTLGPVIKLHLAGKLHYVCEKKDYRDKELVLQNIRLALNTEFDVKRHRNLSSPPVPGQCA